MILKTSRLAFLSSVFFLNIYHLSAEEVTLDQLLYKSSEYLSNGQPQQALELLHQHADTYDTEREFRNNLAIAYLGNSEPERAHSILRSLVENDPTFSIIAHNLVEIELGAAGAKLDQVNPILFVQSVDSFTKGVSVQERHDAKPEDPAKSSAEILLDGALRSSLQSWADAWSNKDFERYIDHYSGNFEPESNLSLQAWKNQRASRLAKPGEISVTISNLEVFTGFVSPRIQFDQIYSSSGYSDKSRKEMTFTQDGNRWKISSEKTIRSY